MRLQFDFQKFSLNFVSRDRSSDVLDVLAFNDNLNAISEIIVAFHFMLAEFEQTLTSFQASLV